MCAWGSSGVASWLLRSVTFLADRRRSGGRGNFQCTSPQQIPRIPVQQHSLGFSMATSWLSTKQLEPWWCFAPILSLSHCSTTLGLKIYFYYGLVEVIPNNPRTHKLINPSIIICSWYPHTFWCFEPHETSRMDGLLNPSTGRYRMVTPSYQLLYKAHEYNSYIYHKP